MDKPLEPTFAFSERALQLTSSAIREILKVTERPEVISFAGGLPAPGGFPVEVVRAAFDKVLSTNCLLYTSQDVFGMATGAALVSVDGHRGLPGAGPVYL